MTDPTMVLGIFLIIIAFVIGMVVVVNKMKKVPKSQPQPQPQMQPQPQPQMQPQPQPQMQPQPQIPGLTLPATHQSLVPDISGLVKYLMGVENSHRIDLHHMQLMRQLWSGNPTDNTVVTVKQPPNVAPNVAPTTP